MCSKSNKIGKKGKKRAAQSTVRQPRRKADEGEWISVHLAVPFVSEATGWLRLFFLETSSAFYVHNGRGGVGKLFLFSFAISPMHFRARRVRTAASHLQVPSILFSVGSRGSSRDSGFQVLSRCNVPLSPLLLSGQLQPARKGERNRNGKMNQMHRKRHIGNAPFWKRRGCRRSPEVASSERRAARHSLPRDCQVGAVGGGRKLKLCMKEWRYKLFKSGPGGRSLRAGEHDVGKVSPCFGVIAADRCSASFGCAFTRSLPGILIWARS